MNHKLIHSNDFIMTRLERVNNLLAKMAAIRDGWPDTTTDLYPIRDECFSMSIFGESSIVRDFDELFSSLHSALLLERTYLIPPSVGEPKSAVDDSLQVHDHGGVPDIDGPPPPSMVRNYGYGLAVDPLVPLSTLSDGSVFELGGIEFTVNESFSAGSKKVPVVYFDGEINHISKLPANIKVIVVTRAKLAHGEPEY